MTFFWVALSLLYQAGFMTQVKAAAYRRMSVWFLTALSMLKEISEFQGNVMASATPFSSASRDSGAETCTLVAPSKVMVWATVPLAGRIFMPLIWPGSEMGFLLCSVPMWTWAKHSRTSFISVAA